MQHSYAFGCEHCYLDRDIVMPSPYVRIRQIPRISANKLGEYLAEHKAARRLSILKDQKNELTCRVIQYRTAGVAIVSSLMKPGREMEELSVWLQRLREWTPGPDESPVAVAENRACREAIEAFMELLPTLELSDLKLKRGANQTPKLVKSGVHISVRPDLVLHGVTRRKQPVVGSLKLHFPKSNPLSKTAAEYVGTLLHEFGEKHLADEQAACVAQHCYVIDVFSKSVYVAPVRNQRRRSDIEAACKEIATLWDAVPVK